MLFIGVTRSHQTEGLVLLSLKKCPYVLQAFAESAYDLSSKLRAALLKFSIRHHQEGYAKSLLCMQCLTRSSETVRLYKECRSPLRKELN